MGNVSRDVVSYHWKRPARTWNQEMTLQTVHSSIDEDQVLCARVRDGDAHAFATLYGRHKQVVYLYCLRFLGRGGAAEDVFQDVFIQCLEQLRGGTDIRSVRAYLMTSARNRCLNALRDRKFADDIDDLGDQLTGDAPLDIAERLDLEEALTHLTPDTRDALLLCEYQGFTYEEIADIVGAPLTAVRKRIFRARQRLRALLAPPHRGTRP